MKWTMPGLLIRVNTRFAFFIFYSFFVLNKSMSMAFSAFRRGGRPMPSRGEDFENNSRAVFPWYFPI